MIKLVRIDSSETLIERLNQIPNHFFYRGHANAAWNLESSLERVIGKKWSAESARKFEDFSLMRFQSKFHLYDRENIEPASKLAWLSLMQHYGVPTRLIDFTESPYVALYFALEAYRPETANNLAIFAIDYTALMERSISILREKDANFDVTRLTLQQKQDVVFDQKVDPFAYDIAWIAEPKQVNARLDRQAGSFLMSGNRGTRIQDVLNSPTYDGVEMTKFELECGLYECLFRLLQKMNINSKSLYGDLAGLAQAIRMEMQVYAV